MLKVQNSSISRYVVIDKILMYITKRYQFISDEQFWELLSKREQADHAAQINASMIDTTNLVKVKRVSADILKLV